MDGMLLDVNEQGMGILVTQALEEQACCTIEIFDEDLSKSFPGVISYITNTDYGLRLGVQLAEDSEDLLDYLDEIHVMLE
ncbi:hypothetical protein PVT67_13055 [Gallaecimonas kandeliae]|nr:hypothetical protein [Gallaecimonas kandeliae]WKE64591.1 hypothetical protein PVT67_13055 [Gallaecimonas kandeliae]